MSKRLYIIVIFITLFVGSFTTLLAEDFYGQIVQEEEKISKATVIVVGLDSIEISDDEGYFVFFDIDPGDYTLKIITLDETEQDFSISIGVGLDNSDNPDIFEIEGKTVVQDEVEEEIIISAFTRHTKRTQYSRVLRCKGRHYCIIEWRSI